MIESPEKQIIRFFRKLMLIAFFIVLADWLTGKVLNHYYFLQKHGPGYLTTYAIDSTQAKILVFGSSRANHSYVPEIFEKELNRSFYNTGRDGVYILHNYAVFRAVAKRYNPEMIIFDIRPEEMKYNPSEYDMLSVLMPYCKNHPEIEEIVDLKGPFEKVKRLSAVYTYNSLIFQIVMGNLERGKDRYSSDKGFVPLKKSMKQMPIDTADRVRFTMDENKLNSLIVINKVCRQNKIDLVFVQSPVWRITVDNAGLNEFFAVNGISYIDMSNLPVFMKNPQYFADRYHLNSEGAEIFSKTLASYLKNNSFKKADFGELH
ncbi:MAG: hypothetical protein ACM3NR_01395 [Methanosarcina sp.]